MKTTFNCSNSRWAESLWDRIFSFHSCIAHLRFENSWASMSCSFTYVCSSWNPFCSFNFESYWITSMDIWLLQQIFVVDIVPRVISADLSMFPGSSIELILLIYWYFRWWVSLWGIHLLLWNPQQHVSNKCRNLVWRFARTRGAI